MGWVRGRVRKLDEIMRETHRIARDNLKGTLRTRKRDYDVKLKTETYQVEDFVYKINSSIKKGVSKKLLPIYDGPFIVTRVLSRQMHSIVEKTPSTRIDAIRRHISL